MDLVFDISINFLLLDDVKFLFLLLLHFYNLGIEGSWIIGFGTAECPETIPAKWLPKSVIIKKIHIILLRRLGELVKVLSKDISSLFCHLKICSFTGLMFQVY